MNIPSTPVDVRLLGQSGMAALKRGDTQAARNAFEKILETGHADASICLALAYACRILNDRQAALAAIDKALAKDSQSLRALVFKADHLHEHGDPRGATAFYLAAVKAASQADVLPPDLREVVAHAQAMCDRNAGDFETFLRARLAERGMVESPSTQRFMQSLDILAGKKARYVQEPLQYFFPELPQVQYFDRADFPWLDAIEAQTQTIREELVAILRTGAMFEPYVQANPNRPQGNQEGMLNNADWSAFYLWKNGEIVADNVARCPKTMSALADVPMPRVSNRSPSILFSLLRPGARIPPHTGMVNTRLICHLPLIVPSGCYFRVGNDVREWKEGKAWVFDDTIEHEAWNESGEVRVILLFEIWRPELTPEERELVGAMFDAIDAHSGTKPVWEI